MTVFDCLLIVYVDGCLVVYLCILLVIFVRLNLINHVLALFRDKFACNTALRNLVFRWESCKGSV